MLYAIVDKASGWSMKLMRDGYHFAPHGFPALFPKKLAEEIVKDMQIECRQCFLRKEVD